MSEFFVPGGVYFDKTKYSLSLERDKYSRIVVGWSHPNENFTVVERSKPDHRNLNYHIRVLTCRNELGWIQLRPEHETLFQRVI
jgi:hypothetical protein